CTSCCPTHRPTTRCPRAGPSPTRSPGYVSPQAWCSCTGRATRPRWRSWRASRPRPTATPPAGNVRHTASPITRVRTAEARCSDGAVATELDRRGVAAAISAYTLWGLFPAFWPLLAPAVPVEVLAHRIMWTAALMVVVISVTRGRGQLRALRPRGWGMVAAAGALVTVNWGLYIYAVFA